MGKGPLVWFPLYAGDYLADLKVGGLTLAQQGILVRLWCYHWQAGALPNHSATLQRITGGSPDDVQVVVGQFFEASDDGQSLTSSRMIEERLKAEGHYRAKCFQAERAREARLSSAKASANSSAKVSPRTPIPSPIPSPSPDTKTRDRKPNCGHPVPVRSLAPDAERLIQRFAKPEPNQP